jgi:Zn-dependent protease
MEMVLMIFVLLFSVIAHEVAHGYVAYVCGDNTAKSQGRLTFNPLPHIDLFGTIIFPLILVVTKAPILFGWAKPVPVNPYNLRNPRRHHMYVSMAGIIANLILAVACTFVYGFYVNVFSPNSTNDTIIVMLNFGIQINIILAVFNILPIPPLDGSWILYHLLPVNLAGVYKKIFPYGFIILIILLMSNVIHKIIIPVYSFILTFLSGLLSVIIQ